MLVVGSLPGPVPEPDPASARVAGAGAGDTGCTAAPSAVTARGAGTKVATTAIVVATTRTSPMRIRQARSRRGAASTTRSVSGGAVLTLEVSERPGGLLTHSEGFPGSCLV